MNCFKRFLPAILIATPLLAFAAFSSANGGLLAIANAGYGGQYTPTITPASATVAPGDHIDFGGRGFGIEENVTITLNGTSVGNAHADGGGNFSTGSITVPTTPGTYTYTFTGSTSNTPVTSTITVSGNEQGGGGIGTGGGGSNANPTVTSAQTVRAGTSIDFSGRNFSHEENVTVSLNGSTVTTAHADGGGNFSTGSVSVSSTPGTYTYTFTGANGDSATQTVTVTQ